MSMTQAWTEKNVKLARKVFTNLDQILLIVNSHRDIFEQLGFSVSRVTDKKSSWILIYENTDTGIYTENGSVTKT